MSRARQVDDADRDEFFSRVCDLLRDLDPPLGDGDVRHAVTSVFRPYNNRIHEKIQMRKNMPIGTVKFWLSDRGFGFIAPDGGTAPDVFVHVSAVRAAGFSDLSRGQRVQFQIGTNARTGRDQATDLTLLDPVISPPVTPHAFRADDLDDATAHMTFGTQRFLRR